jgi:hypothetical protein
MIKHLSILGLAALIPLLVPAGAHADEAGPTPVAVPTIVVTPAPWGDLGPRMYGHNYQVYVPMDLKSDDPDALRSTNVSGYPRNGHQMTPEGAACATDADCKVPMGCFPRADTGAIPIKVCAFPPAY